MRRFELARDYSSLFLALRVLVESSSAITPQSVTCELLAGEVLSRKEGRKLETDVHAALVVLCSVPLLQTERQGTRCPVCTAYVAFSSPPFLFQLVQANNNLLSCPDCGHPFVQRKWNLPEQFTLYASAPSLVVEHAPHLIYCAILPDESEREIQSEEDFWRAVLDSAC